MLRLIPILALLSACTALVPQTLQDLRKVDPLTADPVDFQIHLHLPEGLDLLPDSARLTLTAVSARGAFDESFVLRRRDMRDGSLILTVAPADLDGLRAAQARARTWKTEAPERTSGSLEMSFGLCLHGSGPDMDAPVSADIVLENGGQARPLLRPQPVGRYLKTLKARADTPPVPCPSATRH
ncbi:MULTISPECIES: hypothetical protein [Mameliella]|uniref:hypothetical protein n=1 Tax=Mameliella TaxID=1434019 RepID=UPI000B532D1D|nr:MULTISPECIES: hypothetical protein [Mameliella]MCR9274001.1 hypothetical protein [Paracoccaceae bacterium]OWV61994.1 hypothetical protein CDZ98_05800 [Mameliella alba]